MALINGLNVGEATVKIAQAALAQEAWLQAGKTFNDDYQQTEAGKILIPVVPEGSLEVKTSHRVSNSDFNYDMVEILTNNIYPISKDVPGYSVEALPTDVEMDAELYNMTTIRVARQQSALAILGSGAVDTNTTPTTLTNLKAHILGTRKAMRDDKARPDVILASTDVYALLLERQGTDFTPITNDEVISNGRVGMYYGAMVFENEDLDGASSYKYVDAAGVIQTVDCSDIEYIMYDHRYFSIIDLVNKTQKSPSPDQLGTRLISELDAGMRITNAKGVKVKKAV